MMIRCLILFILAIGGISEEAKVQLRTFQG